MSMFESTDDPRRQKCLKLLPEEMTNPQSTNETCWVQDPNNLVTSLKIPLDNEISIKLEVMHLSGSCFLWSVSASREDVNGKKYEFNSDAMRASSLEEAKAASQQYLRSMRAYIRAEIYHQERRLIFLRDVSKAIRAGALHR